MTFPTGVGGGPVARVRVRVLVRLALVTAGVLAGGLDVVVDCADGAVLLPLGVAGDIVCSAVVPGPVVDAVVIGVVEVATAETTVRVKLRFSTELIVEAVRIRGIDRDNDRVCVGVIRSIGSAPLGHVDELPMPTGTSLKKVPDG